VELTFHPTNSRDIWSVESATKELLRSSRKIFHMVNAHNGGNLCQKAVTDCIKIHSKYNQNSFQSPYFNLLFNKNWNLWVSQS
jgi:hypothetical protein